MKYLIFLLISIVCLLASWSYTDRKKLVVEDSRSVSSLLESLGVDFTIKKPKQLNDKVSVEVGRQLFINGFAKTKTAKAKKQSKHFVCTSCHNIQKEDPDLTVSDPQARLVYTDQQNLPFLQGTTMYGAVSRETYYNGDYFKKYGELVTPARNDIRGAIQLCAVECAQGRPLRDWEMESILSYLWTLDLQISDLNLSADEIETIEDETIADEDKVSLIKSKYLAGSPAHFSAPPVNRKQGSGLRGDPENGKLIYNNSCLHCHYQGKYSYLHLDDTRLSKKHLCNKAPTYHNHSIYQVVRWGVPSKSGKESYMPQYPLEKMSEQQLSDLRAYIDL